MKKLFSILVLVLTVLTAFANTEPDKKLTIYQQGGRYLLEIPDVLLGRDFLIVSRVAKGPGIQQELYNAFFAGEKANENLVRFQKAAGGKIDLLDIDPGKKAVDSSANGIFRSIKNNDLQPVLATFDIKSVSKTGDGVVIDITSLVTGDDEAVFISQSTRSFWNITGFQAAKMSVTDLRSFPTSTVIRTMRTYNRSSGGPITFELSTSFLLLAKEPMRPRYSDARVGYYATPAFTDFDVNPQGTEKYTFITRWRLEPKPADRERYLRGELVEPQKPIVFYIDPATPGKWVPYFIKGVNAWQAAFERAGFKNAIYAVAAPTKEQDSTWSLESAAHSNIIYMPSESEDASYSTVVDPRTGEIVQSHIRWYHNALRLVRNWYFVQASPSDPRARKLDFDDELIGELISQVMSHEVGHALGFPHNFIASYSTPVEKLRDKKWVEANGHTPSIMDYARFNYVAQPEDKIGPAGIFPRIGEYDKWAIEWGYRWFSSTVSVEEEKKTLNKWTVAKAGDSRYWYGGEGLNNDPRSQNEALGDDAMLAGNYGIKNLQFILQHLVEWTTIAGSDYSELKNMHDEIFGQFTYYMMHVSDYIGGVYELQKTAGQPGAVFEPVPRDLQRRALDFLNTQFFKTPQWLVDQNIFKLTGENGVNRFSTIQSITLGRLLNAERLGNLSVAALASGSKTYPLPEYLADLRKMVWAETNDGSTPDAYRINLQNNYIDIIERIVAPLNNRVPRGSQSSIQAAAKANLRALKDELFAAIPKTRDPLALAHFEFSIDRINSILSK